jgi:mannosyltransferase
VLAIVVSAAGAARPSLWFDEAATISASHNRSLAELWRMLGNIDAVHGLYYLVMHGWFAVFPATEFWSRLSSSLAVGAAAAGVVVLGNQIAARQVAVTAGLVFAILPRITWAGIEARSYAMSVAAAVWLTVLVVAAARRQRLPLWALYAFCLIAATLLNIFVGLMVLVHGVTVCAVARNRTTLTWWACSSLAAMLVTAPFLLFTQTQIAQVNWISAPGSHTVVEVASVQYFDHSVPFALLAGATLLCPLLLRSGFDAGQRRLVAIAWAWITLPTAALLTYSFVWEPIYYPRYLCFTTPAVALLLGVSIAAVARTKEATIAVLAALAIAATPNYLDRQRGPYAKEGMDFSQVADVIAAHAQPGDCLILDNTADWKPGPIRPLTAARPSAYEQLVDPGRGMRAADRNRLWDAHVAIWSVTDQVRGCTVLWTVSERDRSKPEHEQGAGLAPGPRLGRAPAYRVPEGFGFHVVERWQFSFAQVVKSTR